MPPRIYNVFPRLVGDLTNWPDHARRARDMGFDWFYVNPFHFPGFSGSIYAVKDYYRVDPLLLPENHPDQHHEEDVEGDGGLGLLADVVSEVRAIGLKPMMDLVVNHTAKDALVCDAHPEWYLRTETGQIESPRAIDPADARKVTVWGDLAELDHAGSSDRDGLWDYFSELVGYYAGLGFEGFRCDAAYKVPSELWTRLISAAREQRPEAMFFGETLGARLEEVESLASSGLHFIFNSSKWWDFIEPWCLEQMHSHAELAPSVSFPESHDTPRLWKESGGSTAVQKQRYAFAASFSCGVLMPVGYEYGFKKRLNVVNTKHEHWEEPTVDLTDFIARVNALKIAHPALAVDAVEELSDDGAAHLLLEKRSGDQVSWIAVNPDAERACRFTLPERDGLAGARVLRVCRDGANGAGAEVAADGAELELAPAEVVFLVPG